MSKRDKLMKIIGDLQEIYPELDVVMIDDIDSPTKVMITTVDTMAEESGLDSDVIEQALNQTEDEDKIDAFLDQVEWDGEDDGDGGMLQ